MTSILTSLSNGAVLLFVVTTMFAMGFGLSLSQILAQFARSQVALSVGLFFLLPLACEIGRRAARTPTDHGGSQAYSHNRYNQPGTATTQPTGAAPTA